MANKTIILYSDFKANFDPHPVTGDLVRITNEQSVGRSIRNILLTAQYERFGDPMFGAGIRALLFELPSKITSDLLRDAVIQAVRNYEDRATLIDVIVNFQPDNNAYSCTVIYSVINNLQPAKISMLLNRIR